jgi:hypothetical protein
MIPGLPKCYLSAKKSVSNPRTAPPPLSAGSSLHKQEIRVSPDLREDRTTEQFRYWEETGRNSQSGPGFDVTEISQAGLLQLFG